MFNIHSRTYIHYVCVLREHVLAVFWVVMQVPHWQWTGIILRIDLAKGRQRYIVTSSLIGWAHIKNYLWLCIPNEYGYMKNFNCQELMVKNLKSQWKKMWMFNWIYLYNEVTHGRRGVSYSNWLLVSSVLKLTKNIKVPRYLHFVRGIHQLQLLPFITLQYCATHFHVMTSSFLQFDLITSLGTAADLGVDGLIIWGNNNRRRPESQCEREKIYLETKLGPYVQKLLDFFQKCSDDLCSSNGRCVKNHVEVDSTKISGDLEKDHVYNVDYVTGLYHCRCYEGWVGQDCSETQNVEWIDIIL